MAWQNIVGHGLAASTHEIIRPYVHAASTVTNVTSPLQSPDVNAIIDATLRGYLRPEACSWACYALGCNVDIQQLVYGSDYQYPQLVGLASLWQAIFESKQEYPSQNELFEIANRQLWEDSRANESLKRLGYFADVVRSDVTQLRYDIPGPGDLVRFAVRHGWEPDLAARLGFDLEYPGAMIDYWHAAKGLDYPLFSGPFAAWVDQATSSEGGAGEWVERYVAAGLPEPTWARMYWWSHWVIMSPSQAYEAYFRLRPDRDPKWDPPEAQGLSFTREDLYLNLRANDYPVPSRPILAAIAHRIPGVRFIRAFRKNQVYSFADVYEWARRWGYSDLDSRNIAESIEKDVQGAGVKRGACQGCKLATQAYELGLLSKEQLQAAYEQFGQTQPEAALNADLAEYDVTVRRAKELISSLRKRFLAGKISAQQAAQALQQYGVTLERMNEYIEDWSAEIQTTQKVLQGAKAIRYACDGLIGVDELRLRLTNLGYAAADVELQVGEALICQANLQARAAAQLERKERQREADLYRAQRRYRQCIIEAQSALAKHGSPEKLRKWFCEGKVAEADVYSRLRYLGWPDSDICRLISDCKAKENPNGDVLTPTCTVPYVAPEYPCTPP